MSNLEYDHPVIVRGFIIKTYDGAPSTGHDSFLLNSYALHLNYLKYHRILSPTIRRGSVQAYNTLFQSPQWIEIVSELLWISITIIFFYKKAAKSHS